jgi:hypothetical protein
MLLHVFSQVCQPAVFSPTLSTGVSPGSLVLLAMFVHVAVKLALNAKLVPTLRAHQGLLLNAHTNLKSYILIYKEIK